MLRFARFSDNQLDACLDTAQHRIVRPIDHSRLDLQRFNRRRQDGNTPGENVFFDDVFRQDGDTGVLQQSLTDHLKAVEGHPILVGKAISVHELLQETAVG